MILGYLVKNASNGKKPKKEQNNTIVHSSDPYFMGEKYWGCL